MENIKFNKAWCLP